MSMSAMPIMGDFAQSMSNPNAGMGVGMDYRNLVNPVADQTQQQIASPIYGQESPFQPPRQQPGMPAVIGGDDPMYNTGMSFGKGGFGGPGQLVGGPAGQPILGGGPNMGAPAGQLTEPYQPNPLQGTLMTIPGQMAGGPAGRPIVGGGLKPQPRNYRAPVRGGILRQRLR